MNDLVFGMVTLDGEIIHKGRRQNALPLIINFSQNVAEPSEGTSYLVGDLCQCRWCKLLFVSSHIHFTNRLPMFPSMFLSSYCVEF